MKAMTFLLAAVAAAAFAGLVPFDSADVVELCPVELLCMEQNADGVHITADGGWGAAGATVKQALKNLDAAVPGRLLLDTVEQVTLTGFLPSPSELLDCGLRPAVRVFTAPQVKEVDRLALYLSRLDSGVTLGQWQMRPTTTLPALVACETGLREARP